MKINIEAIKERCDKAISGPWAMDKARNFEICIYKGPVKKCKYGISHQGQILQMEDPDCSDFKDREIRNTAKFISHSRTDIPALIAYIADLEAVADAAREATNCMNDCPSQKITEKGKVTQDRIGVDRTAAERLKQAFAKLDGDKK